MVNVRSEYTLGLRDEVSSKLKGITTGLDKFKGGVAAIGAAFAVSGAATVALVKSAVDLADNLGKTAQKAGVTVESLSALKFAADLSDVSLEQLAGGLQKLARNMSEAARGSTEAQRGFNALGIDVKNTDGTLRATDDVLTDVAEALSRLPDGATKTALAMQVFGRAGAQLIPLLNGGAEGLQKFREEAEKLGVIISTETSKQAEELNDNFTRLKTAISGLGLSLAKDLVPGFVSLTTEFIRAYKEGSGVLRLITAFPKALAQTARGGDQQRIGQLLADEIEVEEKIAALEDQRSRGFIGRLPYAIRIKSLRDELASIKREAEGLRTVMQPEEFGAGPAGASQPDDPEAKKRAEAAAQLALQSEEEAKKREAEAGRLQKAQDGYLAGLRRQILIEGESTELARVKADIQVGSASKFSEAAKAESLALAEQVDVLRDSADVREYMLGLERSRREEAERANQSANEERRRTIESLRTPDEEYASEVRRLLALDLDQATLQRGIIKAREGFEDATKAVEDTDSAAQQLGLTFSSAFEDAVISGQKLSDVLQGLAQDIARVLLRKSITEPLAEGIGDLFDSEGGGIGDFFKGLFSNARGGLYKVGGGSGEHPVAFSARAGEVVAVGTGMSSGGGITIINNGPPIERAEERGTTGGRRAIELFFGDQFAANLGAGRFSPVGLTPPLASR